MKTYARIYAGKVVELFETDGDISTMFHPAMVWVPVEDAYVLVGWGYADGVFTAPPTSPVVTVVPERVTMRQARLALHSSGRLDAAEAAINSLPEPPRTAARIEWDFSSEVHRNKEFVLMMGELLGLTGEQIDELFITAATL